MRNTPKPRAPSAARAPSANTRATDGGTRSYAARFERGFVPDFYRRTRTGLTISSVALGTYLGDSDDATDALYESACRAALTGGLNVIDTAINYRCQRSERVVGRALQQLIGEGVVRREEVVLCTKAGYVPLDGAPPATRDAYAAYLQREYFDTGVLAPGDLVGGGHALTPDFLEDQLRRSMTNIGVQAVDFFYVHNPEQQLSSIPVAELMQRLRLAFERLESFAERGMIGSYGCATWNALRLPAGSHGHLSLYELVGLAESVAGPKHHFRVVQLPVNLTMSEAVRVSTQRDRRGRLVNVLQAAEELGVDVVVSAPLLQGQLTQNLPDAVRELFGGATDAQRAIGFARSLPVATVAVGTRQAAHLTENLSAVRAG